MTISEHHEHEGDTRVDLATRDHAIDAVDMVKVYKDALIRCARETYVGLQEFDRELLSAPLEDFEREIRHAFGFVIDNAHLRRLERIAKTGRDDE